MPNLNDPVVPKRTHTTILIVFVAVATALVIGSIVYAWQQAEKNELANKKNAEIQYLESQLAQDEEGLMTDDNDIDESEETTEKNGLSEYNTDNYDYKLNSTGLAEQELVRINEETGEEEVVLKKINGGENQFLYAGTEANFSVLLPEPDSSDVIYLYTTVDGTEAGPMSFFSFNVATEVFTKIQFTGTELPKPLPLYTFASPSGTLMVMPDLALDRRGAVQNLYLVDLENETSEKIVTLNSPESLNGGGAALNAYYDISWTDDDSVRYAVYSQDLKPDTGVDGTSFEEYFVEYRSIDTK